MPALEHLPFGFGRKSDECGSHRADDIGSPRKERGSPIDRLAGEVIPNADLSDSRARYSEILFGLEPCADHAPVPAEKVDAALVSLDRSRRVRMLSGKHGADRAAFRSGHVDAAENGRVFRGLRLRIEIAQEGRQQKGRPGVSHKDSSDHAFPFQRFRIYRVSFL
mgnify:CR=1 FL=1